MIYLDNNASTPVLDAVREAMLPYLERYYANASAIHGAGKAARRAIDVAREQVAELVNAHPSEVCFTSGGTEANNSAIKGYYWSESASMAYSAIEHDSVIQPMRWLASRGAVISEIPVDNQGVISEEAFAQCLNKQMPGLISIMMANNETGVVQPIARLAEQLDGRALLHTDAVQAAGKIAVDFQALGVDMMSLSAHKIYGPKGVGALIAKKQIDWVPLLHGGGHEKGRRSGTENVAAIVGFGLAAQLARQQLQELQTRLQQMLDSLKRGLSQLPGVILFAQQVPALPNTVMFSVAGFAGETLLMNLDQAGIAVGSGSACHSGRVDPSHVLMAMGVDRQIAEGAIRVSLGRYSTQDDVDKLLTALKQQIDLLGKMAVMDRV